MKKSAFGEGGESAVLPTVNVKCFWKEKKNLEHRKLKPASNFQMFLTLSTQVCSLTKPAEGNFTARILPDWTLIHKLRFVDLEPELNLITLDAGSLRLTSVSAQFLRRPC